MPKIKNEDMSAYKLAKHFGRTYEAMRQLKRKYEADKTGLWIVYVKAYNWDMVRHLGKEYTTTIGDIKNETN